MGGLIVSLRTLLRNHCDCTNPNSILPKRVLDVGTETEKWLLLHISSGEVEPYVALSYFWGGLMAPS
jgi:hypothetical protein